MRFGGMEGVGAWRRWRWRWRGRRCEGCVVETNGGCRGRAVQYRWPRPGRDGPGWAGLAGDPPVGRVVVVRGHSFGRIRATASPR